MELQLFVYAKVIRRIKEDGNNSIIAVHLGYMSEGFC